MPSWQQVPESQLAQPEGLKSAYRKAIIACHPDKIPMAARDAGSCSKAGRIFDTLKGAHNNYMEAIHAFGTNDSPFPGNNPFADTKDEAAFETLPFSDVAQAVMQSRRGRAWARGASMPDVESAMDNPFAD